MAAYDVHQAQQRPGSIESQLRNEKTSEEQRRTMRDRIRQLDGKRYRLRDDQRNAEYQLDLLSGYLLRGAYGR